MLEVFFRGEEMDAITGLQIPKFHTTYTNRFQWDISIPYHQDFTENEKDIK